MRPSLWSLLALSLALPACARPPITPEQVDRLHVCTTDQAAVHEQLGFPDQAGQLSTLIVWSYWKFPADRTSGRPPVLTLAFDAQTYQLVDLAYNVTGLVRFENRCRPR